MAPRHRGRFTNLNPNATSHFGKVVKWMVVDSLTGRRRRSPAHSPVPVISSPELPASSARGATWLGHATVLLTLGGLRIMTDPVFAPRMGLSKRNVPVVLTPQEMPPIDLVVISHNHRDHLDEPSIRAIESQMQPRYLTPLGIDQILTRWGVAPERVTTLDWWASGHPLPSEPDKLKATCVPAQHWSMRTPFDRNATLWGGFVLEAGQDTVYFVGDSGYFDAFVEIGRRFPQIDLALIPIGAYDPRWFMSPQHMDPQEAGQVFLDVGAQRFLPIHWGTYKLTDEPLDEPPKLLRAWADERGLKEDRVRVLPVGGTWTW